MPDLLFEIGTEELPPGSIHDLSFQLKRNILNELKENDISLSEDKTSVFYTPRRIAIYTKNLPAKQATKTVETKGPDRNKAFDAKGNLTQAGAGFAKKFNLDPKDLKVKNVNGTEYVFAEVKVGGKEIKEILTSILPNSLRNTTGEKFMKWGSYDERFARPIRWILAILNNEVINFSYAGIESTNFTYGHKFLSNKKIKISSPENYLKALKNEYVIASQEDRKVLIEDFLMKEAQNINASLSSEYKRLLSIANNLVEYPYSVLCHFDESFLSLPPKVIETVLEKHQKYFVLNDKSSGKLLPNFIVITNGIDIVNKKAKENIIQGNEKVARARLNDAKFFFNEDLKVSFTYENRCSLLDKITFQKGLGSMLEKVNRLCKLSEHIYNELSNSNQVHCKQEEVKLTAKLCKLDLTTHMVFEFTELEGEIGSIYALLHNAPPIVSQGIKEHYLPRYAGDKIPETDTGFIVGLGDKVDNIVTLFSIGKIPKGSADPFALRRQAQGIVEQIIAKKIRINLTNLIKFAVNLIKEKVNLSQESRQNLENLISDFLIQRFISSMENNSFDIDLINSVISVNNPLANILEAQEKITVLKQLFTTNKKEKYNPFLVAAKRLVRIVEGNINGKVDVNDFSTEHEKNLFSLFNKLNKIEFESYEDFLNELLTLTEPINTFFDNVLVNDPDPKIRQCRQSLLQIGKQLFEKVCDFNKITER